MNARRPLHAQRVRAAWRFALPACALLLLAAALPLARTVWLSLTDASADDPSRAAFVGLANYLSCIGGRCGGGVYGGVLGDARWWQAVRNTVVFAVASVALELVVGMAVALSLDRPFPGRALVRTAVLVPWALPTIVSAQMWGWMLHDQYGIVNWMLRGLGAIEDGIPWLAQPSTALAAIVVIDAWKSTPFMALMLLAALQTVPGELRDAARIDGATPWQALRRVVLPTIFPAVAVAVVFRLLDALRVFDLIYIVNPAGEDVASMSVYARRLLFEYGRFGEGSAASVLLFAVVGGIAIAWIRVTRVIDRAEGGR
ncbi:carbohydrate ABC transporter permease [Xylophilus sp.]|uniref:carbohydrate ABC transporter permease n=1 Tax=Xylophilus sp. TaxID=2653893 RepID=UPI0013BDC66D|nr:sugar ABC transporter permease [Xylophilus sp.]KAF1048214.1 MAG: Trehalose transport system permease protein SugA [Xylophilus sp.]